MLLYDKTGKTEINPNTLASLVTLANGKTVEEVLNALPTNEEFKLTQVRYYSSDSINPNELDSVKWDNWVKEFSSINLGNKKYVWAWLKTQYGTAEDNAKFIIYVTPTPKMVYLATKTLEELAEIKTSGKSYTELLRTGWTEYPLEIKDGKIYSWGVIVNSDGKCGDALLIGKYPD